MNLVVPSPCETEPYNNPVYTIASLQHTQQLFAEGEVIIGEYSSVITEPEFTAYILILDINVMVN